MPLYAGFDLGGTHLKYGLIDDGGKIAFSARAESPAKIEELIHLLERIWQDLKKREKIHNFHTGRKPGSSQYKYGAFGSP